MAAGVPSNITNNALKPSFFTEVIHTRYKVDRTNACVLRRGPILSINSRQPLSSPSNRQLPKLFTPPFIDAWDAVKLYVLLLSCSARTTRNAASFHHSPLSTCNTLPPAWAEIFYHMTLREITRSMQSLYYGNACDHTCHRRQIGWQNWIAPLPVSRVTNTSFPSRNYRIAVWWFGRRVE